MDCIKCHHSTQVINSRPSKSRPSVWRRRRCTNCALTFTTRENIDIDQLTIMVGVSGKETFSPHRLAWSLRHHLLRSGSHNTDTVADDAYWLAQTIGELVWTIRQSNHAAPIDSIQLSWLTYDVLQRYDKLAALTYGVEHKIVSPTGKQRTRPDLGPPSNEHFIYT